MMEIMAIYHLFFVTLFSIAHCDLREGVTEFYDSDDSPVHMIVSGSVLVSDEPKRITRSYEPHLTVQNEKVDNNYDDESDGDELTYFFPKIYTSATHNRKTHPHRRHNKSSHTAKKSKSKQSKKRKLKVVKGQIRDEIPDEKHVKGTRKSLYPPPSNLWVINQELANTEQALLKSGKLSDAPQTGDYTDDQQAIITDEGTLNAYPHPEMENSDVTSNFNTKEDVPKLVHKADQRNIDNSKTEHSIHPAKNWLNNRKFGDLSVFDKGNNDVPENHKEYHEKISELQDNVEKLKGNAESSKIQETHISHDGSHSLNGNIQKNPTTHMTSINKPNEKENEQQNFIQKTQNDESPQETVENLDEGAYANSFQHKLVNLYMDGKLKNFPGKAYHNSDKNNNEEESSVKQGGYLLNGKETEKIGVKPHLKTLVIQTKINKVNLEEAAAKGIPIEQPKPDTSESSIKQQDKSIPEEDIENPAGYTPQQRDESAESVNKQNTNLLPEIKEVSHPVTQKSFKELLTQNIKENLAKINPDEADHKAKEVVHEVMSSKAKQKEPPVIYPRPSFNEFKQHKESEEKTLTPQPVDQNSDTYLLEEKQLQSNAYNNIPVTFKEKKLMKVNNQQDSGELSDKIDFNSEKPVTAHKDSDDDQVTITADPSKEDSAHVVEKAFKSVMPESELQFSKTTDTSPEEKISQEPVSETNLVDKTRATEYLLHQHILKDSKGQQQSQPDAQFLEQSKLQQQQLQHEIHAFSQTPKAIEADPVATQNVFESSPLQQNSPTNPGNNANEIKNAQIPSTNVPTENQEINDIAAPDSVNAYSGNDNQQSFGVSNPTDTQQVVDSSNLKEQAPIDTSSIEEKEQTIKPPDARSSSLEQIPIEDVNLSPMEQAPTADVKSSALDQTPIADVKLSPLEQTSTEDVKSSPLEQTSAADIKLSPLEQTTAADVKLPALEQTPITDDKFPAFEQTPTADVKSSQLGKTPANQLEPNEVAIKENELQTSTEGSVAIPEVSISPLQGISSFPQDSKSSQTYKSNYQTASQAEQEKNFVNNLKEASTKAIGVELPAPYQNEVNHELNPVTEKIPSSGESDVWPAGVNPGALYSSQMPQRELEEPTILKNTIDFTTTKKPPVKLQSFINLLNPKRPTGPSIAYDITMPGEVRAVYTSSKSKAKASASSKASSSSSSNTNTAKENGAAATTSTASGANARHDGPPAPSYGQGSGSGYGYGRQSWGYGGGGGWAGSPPPANMPLPFPALPPPHLPSIPNANSGSNPAPAPAQSGAPQASRPPANGQASPSYSKVQKVKSVKPVKVEKLKQKYNHKKPINKIDKITTTNVKVMQHKQHKMRKVQQQTKFEKIKPIQKLMHKPSQKLTRNPTQQVSKPENLEITINAPISPKEQFSGLNYNDK